MSDRGVIQHRDRARQILDFHGLQYERGITPTDIDLFLDFENKAFVFGEIKHRDTQLTYGQRLALERLVDACPITSILFIARHNIDDCEQDVDVSILYVDEYRWERVWKDVVKQETVRQFIDRFHRFVYRGFEVSE